MKGGLSYEVVSIVVRKGKREGGCEVWMVAEH